MKLKKGILLLSLMSLTLAGCYIRPKCEHEFEPWEIVDAPTCLESGLAIHECKLCGFKGKAPLPKNSECHVWVQDSSKNRAATCSTYGIEGSMKCILCGELKPGNRTPMSEHSWDYLPEEDQPVGYKEATCSEEGIYYKRCRNCNAYSDPFFEQVKPHDYIALNDSTGLASHFACKNCDSNAYELKIRDASGWNYEGLRMDSNNTSTWTIGKGEIPAGTYDILLEAKCHKETDRVKKFYNLQKALLAVDEEMAAADRATNSESAEPDETYHDDFRYTIKVNTTEYYPFQTETWYELGLESMEKSGSKFNFVKFVNRVVINSNTKIISLCHKNIPTSLYCKSIRLVPTSNTD